MSCSSSFDDVAAVAVAVAAQVQRQQLEDVAFVGHPLANTCHMSCLLHALVALVAVAVALVAVVAGSKLCVNYKELFAAAVAAASVDDYDVAVVLR